MSQAPLSPRYMTRFRCIAERCEDTCCAGWRVPMSEARLRHLQQTVAGTPDAARVEQLVQLNPFPINPKEHALISLQENGDCSFLDPDRLCSLQRRHGETVLADPCFTFPRAFTYWGERLEVAASLACPEIARLALLSEDALELVPAPPEQQARAETGRRFDAELAADAEVLRTAVLQLFRRREYPFASRLVLLAHLGAHIEADFKALEDLQGEARAQARKQLEEKLRHFETPEVLEPLHRDFQAMPEPDVPNASLFTSVLKARTEHTRSARYETFVRKVLAAYEGAANGESEDPRALWLAYVQRCAKMDQAYGSRLDQYFTHHALNHWTRAVVTRMPGTLVGAFRYILRVAVLRWVLMSHPEVVALCSGTPPPLEKAQPTLDAIAVECFQLMAKQVEQASDFLALANELAGSGGEETLGGSIMFARLCDLGRPVA
ncbi:flagellin lysine-N-methylase [Hyalangium minutum]|uniref:Lysine-N-methylase n=1 Tax=Hyalangium minutum TaxID=394096 RepID=A0A085WEY1_9BACT|nr:flagellin lysine-N-methylase [Hyalangium minutum]KFE66244.1 Lysine-N-methylase [Hyalangium minutum]